MSTQEELTGRPAVATTIVQRYDGGGSDAGRCRAQPGDDMSIPNTFRPLCGPADELPPGYTRVKCLVAAQGNVYFDTGLTPDIGTKWSLDLQYLDTGWQCNGAQNWGTSTQYESFCINCSGGKHGVQTGSAVWKGSVYSALSRMTVTLDAPNGIVSFGGDSINVNYVEQVHSNIFIFARSWLGLADFCKEKVFGSKIWQQGYLISNLIPALDSDGAPVFYDAVRKITLVKKGSGTLAYEL